MLQSAIFADLHVNNFGIPLVRLAPHLPVIGWMRNSFSQLWARRGDVPLPVSEHLRRDIGLCD